MNPIYMHVNFLERIYSIEKLIELCAQAGYDGLEMRSCMYIKNDLEDYLDFTFKTAQKNGIGITYGCGNGFYASDEQFKKSLEDFKKVIDFAGRNNIKTLNAFGNVTVKEGCEYYEFDKNGSACVSSQQYSKTVDYLQQAGKFAKENGVLLCLETHHCYAHDLAEPTIKLLDDIGEDNIRVNFDYGNIFLNKKNLGMEKETEMLLPKTNYLHIKNMRKLTRFGVDAFWGTALQEGDIDNFKWLSLIKEAQYEDIITIENTMSGDRRPYMHQDLAYLKGILNDLENVKDPVNQTAQSLYS